MLAAVNQRYEFCTKARCRSLAYLPPQAIDFEGEVNLFHFYLLRSVGKGAFGKVCNTTNPMYIADDEAYRSVLSNISIQRLCSPSSISINKNVLR